MRVPQQMELDCRAEHLSNSLLAEAGSASMRDCVKTKYGFQEWDETPKNWRKNNTLSQLLAINPLPAG